MNEDEGMSAKQGIILFFAAIIFTAIVSWAEIKYLPQWLITHHIGGR
jgi:hypothetical protein